MFFFRQKCDENTFQKLTSLFAQIPPDRQAITHIFRRHSFTQEQLSQLAVDLAEDCFREHYDALDVKVQEVTPEHMHSNHLIESLKQLLQFGLDPNLSVGEYEDNVMWDLQYVDAPNVGASAMRLLLENGADPNLILPSEGESVFDDLAFKVSYDCYSHEYFFMVQCWLVLMAFGGCWRDGSIPLTMLNGHQVGIFKEFEYYDYKIEMLPQEPGYYGCWIMHIFDTRTGEEVARYK